MLVGVKLLLLAATAALALHARLRLIPNWSYPDSVDRFQDSTGTSVRVLVNCCS